MRPASVVEGFNVSGRVYGSRAEITPGQLEKIRVLLTTDELLVEDKNGIPLDEALYDLTMGQAAQLISELLSKKSREQRRPKSQVPVVYPASQAQWKLIKTLYGTKGVSSRIDQKAALSEATGLGSFDGLTTVQADKFIRHLLTLPDRVDGLSANIA